jgi:hypothetical protein
MLIALAKLRLSWIALAAFVGASLVTDGASAACTPMPDAGACPPVCGCCKASESATPIRAAAEPLAVGEQIPSRDGNACPFVPGCQCRPPAPTAPQPKERRAEESRPDPGRIAAAGWLDPGGVFRPYIGPVPPTSSPPQASPLYLRNSRLLI